MRIDRIQTHVQTQWLVGLIGLLGVTAMLIVAIAVLGG